jgi:hypothetical protein
MRPKGRNRRSGLCQSGSSGLTPLVTEKQFAFSVMRYSAALNPLSELVQPRRISHDASVVMQYPG